MDNVIDFQKMKEEIFDKKDEECKKHIRSFLINAYTDGGLEEVEKCCKEVADQYDGLEEKKRALSQLIMTAREVIGAEVANELTIRFRVNLGLKKHKFEKKEYSSEVKKEANDFFKVRLRADADVFKWDYKEKLDAINKLAIRASNDKEVLFVETQNSRTPHGTLIIKDGAELMNGKMAVGLILLNADEIKITTQYAPDATSVIVIEYTVVAGNDEIYP